MPFHKIRVLICQEDGAWTAQGIDVDIAAQADSVIAVQSEWERMFLVQMLAMAQEGVPPESLRPAPSSVHEKYRKALAVERFQIRLAIEESREKRRIDQLELAPRAVQPEPEYRLAA